MFPFAVDSAMIVSIEAKLDFEKSASTRRKWFGWLQENNVSFFRFAAQGSTIESLLPATGQCSTDSTVPRHSGLSWEASGVFTVH